MNKIEIGKIYENSESGSLVVVTKIENENVYYRYIRTKIEAIMDSQYNRQYKHFLGRYKELTQMSILNKE